MAYDKELSELRSIVQGVANSAAEQRASIKDEMMRQVVKLENLN